MKDKVKEVEQILG